MAEHAASPGRRSTGDLQKILASLFGDRTSIVLGELPSALRNYEEAHDIMILEESHYDQVNVYCAEHGEMEMPPDSVFQLLSILTQMNRQPAVSTASSSTHPSMPHSASLPPSSFRAMQDQTTPRPRKSRRHSDRIRSPSDSSGTSSDSDDGGSTAGHLVQKPLPPRPRGERQTSAPPQIQNFPISQSHSDLYQLGGRPGPPLPTKRTKKLSDPEQPDMSPLAQRLKSAGTKPPSSFAWGGATSFARPSPATRRRRGSSSAQSASGMDDLRSPDIQPRGFGRTASSGSLATTSPKWSARDRDTSQPSSPISPTGPGMEFGSLDNRLRAKSPEGMSDVGLVEGELPEVAIDDADDGEEREETDEVDYLSLGDGMQGGLNPRLSRLSTGSASSLRTSHDKLRELQKQNADLARKLKESEKQLSIIGADNERMVEELQEKLEEARSEITQRRKDEKEWKGKERALSIQIAGFEADISSLQRTLENSKANHSNMQKMYNSQCDEAQRLRDLLRDRDNEIQDLETAAQGHEADEDKSNREIAALEAEIKRVEADLAVARQAEGYLETQKQENLQLKETIDRMRFDLDEARTVAANASGGHTRTATASSGPGTLSRNLGDELTRRLVDAERVRKEGGEDEEDGYVETIVTRQRRKIGGKPPSSQLGLPPIHIEDDVREYADVGVGESSVDSEPSTPIAPIAGPSRSQKLAENPPAYTRNPEPIDAKAVLEQAHPREPLLGEELDEEYAAVVSVSGMRCTVMEEELGRKRAERAKFGSASSMSSSTLSFSARRKYARPDIISFVFHKSDSLVSQAGQLAFCLGAAFIVGISIGAHMYHSRSGIHPRDLQLFAAMNSLAIGTGVGEGFVPGGGAVAAVARFAAGRVPT